jgi:hypothetical protein
MACRMSPVAIQRSRLQARASGAVGQRTPVPMLSRLASANITLGCITIAGAWHAQRRIASLVLAAAGIATIEK